MAREVPNLKKYVELFQEHMQVIDRLQVIILTGHLIIEGALDNIISIIFLHPNHILEGRFGFDRKVKIVKAYALRKDNNSIWALIQSVNAVRNEIAHNLIGEKRTKKMTQLRRMYLAEASPEIVEKHKDAPDEVIAMYACIMCTGFLGTYEYDVQALRGYIDTFDEAMNPDMERVKAPKLS